MRVFLSVYPGFTLAIPMDVVASMMLYNQKTEKTIQYDQKSRCTFISLPWLFNMRDQPVPHGIVLREWNSKENKVVLLTAGIKRDIEIPDGEFYPMPKALGVTRFSAVFSGIKFSGNPVLLLNVERLLQIIQNEQWVTDKKPTPQEQPLSAVSPEPSPPTLNKVVEKTAIGEPAIEKPPIEKPPIEEPPTSPAAAPEPPTPIPTEVIEEIVEEPAIEEPPVEEVQTSPVEASKPSSMTLDEIIKLCGVEIIKEPPTSPAAASEPPPPPALNEVVEEPLTSPAESPEPSPPARPAEASDLTLDEVLEVCEIINEPPISPAEASEPSPPTPKEDIEAVEDIEIIEAVEDIEVCENIEVCEIIEEIEEPPTSPAETTEVFSLTLDDVLELCDVIDLK